MRYLCYDSALNEVYTLLLLQKAYPVHMSLFSGTKDEQLWHVAPWLFEITTENFYTKWDDPNCQLQRCLIIESASKLQDLKLHLQQFNYKQKDGAEHFNRFWDARVLAQQLERMDTKELSGFFDEIEAITVQDENRFLKFTLDQRGRLLRHPITEQEVFNGASVQLVIEEKTTEEPRQEAKPKRKFFIE